LPAQNRDKFRDKMIIAGNGALAGLSDAALGGMAEAFFRRPLNAPPDWP
jgi:hypothetical protein